MLKIATVSDFNLGNFAALLRNDGAEPAVAVVETPFGQPFQILADPSHPTWAEAVDCLIVWTQPQRVISSFAQALEHEQVDRAKLFAEVDQFAALVRSCQDRARMILVPTWTLPPWERGSSLLECRPGVGLADLLARMNQRLAEQLEGSPPGSTAQGASQSNVFVLDAQRWLVTAGIRSFSTKAWYLGKIPFSNEIFKQAVKETKAALRAISGATRKLVVVDLDDTLWGGIVGDIGLENLTLGGHDGDGEALVDFQRALKALTRRGIILGVVSKNDETTALTALREHPEMILRPDDFAGWRINWGDKAQNVVDLAAELNLGLQSVVFIDDNPVERARVREMLPEVLVPEWPADKTLYRRALLELNCFDVAALTQEDRNRAAMYVSDRERKHARRTVGSLDDWLASLNVTIEIEFLNEANLTRAAQLLNKTNQMNLTTRRMTEQELLAWSSEPDHRVWTIKVRDKFGDLGLTGLLSVETKAASLSADGAAPSGAARIADFVLSCRVMGRKIEETMVAFAVRHARDEGARVLTATYLPTPKNKPCLEFLRRSGMRESSEGSIFEWNTAEDYPVPHQVTIGSLDHALPGH